MSQSRFHELVQVAIQHHRGLAAFDAGPQIYTTAFTVFQLPHAIFAVSIFTALLPGMSERWATGDRAGVRAFVSRGLRDTIVIALPT